MIISQNDNDVYYAYTRGRFWRWDESAQAWKESHLLAQKFDKAKAAEKHLTPEAFLTSDEFIPMDDYELPDQMLTALRDAKPCKNAPIEPVEEDSSSGVPAPCICSTCTCGGCKEECFGNCHRCSHPVQECNSYQTEGEKHLTPAHSADVDEPEVSGTQTAQDKPLTTVPDEMRPAFDYSGLDTQTVEDLHFAEDEYRHGKQMAERGLVHMGNAIAAAHDALCGVVAQCDNSKHGNRGEDSFRAWCLHIGITKDSAYRLLQVSALLADSSPRQQAILESLPPTLLYAVAKPSAPPELVEKVKNGEVTTNKAYQDLLKENQQLRTDRVEAMNLADLERARADRAESERDKARADQLSTAKDCNRLGLKVSQEKDRADKAEAREEEAWKLQSKAEERAQEAEKQLEGSRQVAEAAKLRADKLQEENAALKKQPIAAVVDEEEVDRRAKALAHQWDEEELDRLAAEKAWGLADARNSELAKDNTALRKQLATLQARANDNTQADFETANYCASLFRSAWDTCKGSYSRLTGEDLESTFQALCGALNSIMEEASLLCRQPADYDGGAADEPDV